MLSKKRKKNLKRKEKKKEYPKECIIASSDVADLLRNFSCMRFLYEKFLNYFKLCLTKFNPIKNPNLSIQQFTIN